MRYSFHGKVRATGQPVDGYVEAPNSSMAIDRLADRGIIGVYSVRPEPEPPPHSVRLEGEPAPPELQAPRLEAPAPPPPAPPPPPAKVESGSEAVFAQLVDKLGSLLVQVEKLMSRPAQQVIYQTSHTPAREYSRPKKHHVSQENSGTLRDIFQTNLDLRQSLEKLASSTGTANRMADAAAKVSDAATRLTESAVSSAAGPAAGSGDGPSGDGPVGDPVVAATESNGNQIAESPASESQTAESQNGNQEEPASSHDSAGLIRDLVNATPAA